MIQTIDNFKDLGWAYTLKSLFILIIFSLLFLYIRVPIWSNSWLFIFQ